MNYFCMCGWRVPCPYEKHPAHGVGSFFRTGVTGRMSIDDESEARTARAILGIVNDQSSPEKEELQQALREYEERRDAENTDSEA